MTSSSQPTAHLPSGNSRPAIRRLLLFAIPVCVLTNNLSAQSSNPVPDPGAIALLNRWLDLRESSTSFKGEFTQTTRLHTFKKEIRRTGVLWAKKGGFLRCELRNEEGRLVTTILKNRAGAWLIREDKQEYQPLAEDSSGVSGLDTLQALGAREDFNRRFKVSATSLNDGVTIIELAPVNPSLQRRLKRLRIHFPTGARQPSSFDLQFADDSRVRTDALRTSYDAPIQDDLFLRDLSALKAKPASRRSS